MYTTKILYPETLYIRIIGKGTCRNEGAKNPVGFYHPFLQKIDGVGGMLM